MKDLKSLILSGLKALIAKSSKPSPVEVTNIKKPPQRVPGNDDEKVTLSSDFDAPLEEFEK